MSSTRIPFNQVFKSATDTPKVLFEEEMDPADFVPRDVSSPPRGRQPPPKGNNNMSLPTQIFKGTRTPQMLEYERQAEERAREQEAMQEERDRMMETELKIQKEKERIEQEEYEMRQYYEAEALKHAEELRYHQEEVRRHQDRLRAHERMVMDHEASSEAFAKVIAMPVAVGNKRQVSFYRMPVRLGGSSSSSGSRNGSLDNGYGNGA